MGKSTFELGVSLMKWMPIWAVDKVLLLTARLILGNIEKYGLKRPSIGPLHLKNTQGKTPVLDIGTLSKIRSGHIEIVPGIKKFSRGGAEFVNGEAREFDSVILATGYSSNVPSWLKVCDHELELFTINLIFIFFSVCFVCVDFMWQLWKLGFSLYIRFCFSESGHESGLLKSLPFFKCVLILFKKHKY